MSEKKSRNRFTWGILFTLGGCALLREPMAQLSVIGLVIFGFGAYLLFTCARD